MRIYPAPHYTMGGLWVDYNLMSTLDGLYVIGEANFSDHGANRLGASALMQGLADGYFVLPYTIGDYLSRHMGEETISTDHSGFKAVEDEVEGRIERLLSIDGQRTVDSLHRELGHICLDLCGMSRNRAGLEKALDAIAALREEYWGNLKLVGTNEELNQSLEKAGRVADYFELAELMCRDALDRQESCGTHFRDEYQTPEGEALRNDEDYTYVSAWEYRARARSRRSTRSLSSSKMCRRPRGATSDAFDPPYLAPEELPGPRPVRDLSPRRGQPRYVFSRDAGCAQ